MEGFFSLLLHAHLPYVRHPEHPRFLEENWLFEAITECYLPLLEKMESWRGDEMRAPLTITLTPTLCAMLLDPLLQHRYSQYLNGLIELAERETHRTHWDKELQPLASFYFDRFQKNRAQWDRYNGNLIAPFKALQDDGRIEIITSAATHALLPLMESYPESIRAQILVARDHYKACFGRDPRGIWLPECAYVADVENVLQEANIRWFVTDTHGLLYARPRPRYGTFAPIYTQMASPYLGAITIPPGRSGAAMRVIPAIRITAIFTATLRLTWTLIT